MAGPKESWEVFLSTCGSSLHFSPLPYPKPPQPKSFPFPSISTYINLSFWPRDPLIFCSWSLGLRLLSRFTCLLPSSLSLFSSSLAPQSAGHLQPTFFSPSSESLLMPLTVFSPSYLQENSSPQPYMGGVKSMSSFSFSKQRSLSSQFPFSILTCCVI